MDTDKKDGHKSKRNIFFTDIILLICIGFIKFIVHITTNAIGGYGYFRDELYYIACGDHMAWGYVDQPPLSIATLWLNRLFLGDSIFLLYVSSLQ
jgi:hypothetical protein